MRTNGIAETGVGDPVQFTGRRGRLAPVHRSHHDKRSQHNDYYQGGMGTGGKEVSFQGSFLRCRINGNLSFRKNKQKSSESLCCKNRQGKGDRSDPMLQRSRGI